MTKYLTCKDVAHLISEGLDRNLPPPERARMRLHFVICTACRNVEQQMGFLRRAMRRLDDDPDAGKASPRDLP